MSVPKYAPVPPLDDARGYESPDHVPDPWMPDRPAMIRGFQPEGGRLGYQGPDQGFGIKIARTFRDRLQLAAGEEAEDAMTGCLAIGLRRASLFGRAPVVHDMTVAYTAWGFLDAAAPAELVALRRPRFAGISNVAHHYSELRALVDMVPEATLRMTPQQVAGAYPARWRELVGA
jgi:hypothetical protein